MKNLVRLLRPHQWIKNGFVLVGLLFGHAWSDPVRLTQGLWAFVAFCLLSSTVYVFNDLLDREQDRLHPKKRNRPLASGAISVPVALCLLAFCLSSGLFLAFSSAGSAPWVFVSYLVINIVYSLGAKHIVVLDVFMIASGFMLRLLAGTVGLGISPSLWLLLCGLMLTLFLGFAKRRAELAVVGDDPAAHRRVLEDYSEPMLDQFTTISASCAVLSYSLYTVSAEVVALHGTTHLLLTLPFVLYGMFRYLFLLHKRGGGGDTASDLIADPHLILSVAGWLATVLAVLTGRL